MRLRDLATFASLALIWGFSFFILVKTLGAFGWVGTSSFRSIIAGFTVLAIMRLQGKAFAFAAHWKELMLLGLAASALQYLGIAYGAPLIGTAIIFGCAAAATGSVYANARLTRVDPWTVTAGSFFSGGVMLLPLLYFVPLPRLPEAVDVLWLVLLGGLVTGVGYLQYFKLVQAIGPTRAVSVEFVVTVIAVTVGAVLLGERLSVVQLCGAAVVLVGCTLVLGLVPRRLMTALRQP